MHLATYTITPCSNYHANINDSLFALISNISYTDFIDNEDRLDISGLGVLEYFDLDFASLNKSEYSHIILHNIKTKINFKDSNRYPNYTY